MAFPMYGEHHGRVFVGIDGPFKDSAWAQPNEGDPDSIIVYGLVLCSKKTGKPVSQVRADKVWLKAPRLT